MFLLCLRLLCTRMSLPQKDNFLAFLDVEVVLFPQSERQSNFILSWAGCCYSSRQSQSSSPAWPSTSVQLSTPAQSSCSRFPACSAWFGAPACSSRSCFSAHSSWPSSSVSPSRRMVTPTPSGRWSSPLLLAHCSSPGCLASWQSFSHHRTPVPSSHSESHQSSYICTLADQGCSSSPIHGSSSHLTCSPKDKAGNVKSSHWFPVPAQRG